MKTLAAFILLFTLSASAQQTYSARCKITLEERTVSATRADRQKILDALFWRGIEEVLIEERILRKSSTDMHGEFEARSILELSFHVEQKSLSAIAQCEQAIGKLLRDKDRQVWTFDAGFLFLPEIKWQKNPTIDNRRTDFEEISREAAVRTDRELAGEITRLLRDRHQWQR